FFKKYYQETINELSDMVNGLTKDQLHFKPADSVWSISQIMEHIVLTEKMLANYIKEAMAKPANPEHRADNQYSDEEILDKIRKQKVKLPTTAILIGTIKYNDTKEAIDELTQQHESFLVYVDGLTVSDLLNRVNDTPTGATDAFQ